MLKQIVKFIVLAGFVALINVISSPGNTAHACTGVSSTIQQFVAGHEYAVLAEVLEVDATGFNARLKVESYLSGTAGPEYVMFSQFDTGVSLAVSNGNLSSSCYSRGDVLEPGNKVVTFLNRNSDGTYSPRTTLDGDYDSILVFASDEAHPIPYRFDRDGEYVEDRWRDPLVISAQEFAEWVTYAAGTEPLAPEPNERMPLLSPVLLQTETDSAYMLPVDFQTPVLLAESVEAITTGGAFIGIRSDGHTQLVQRQHMPALLDMSPHDHCLEILCVAFSDAGLNIAFFYPEGASLETDIVYFEPESYGLHIVDGMDYARHHTSFYFSGYFYHDDAEAALFSGKNFAVAVWTPDRLVVETCYTFATCGPPSQIEREVRGPIIGRGAWSPDQRMLAYSDEEGLWLWDVFSENGYVELLLEPNDDGTVPTALHFSDTGRYLAIENQGERAALDLVNAEQTGYGLFNPTDFTVIMVDWRNKNMAESVCELVGQTECWETRAGISQIVWTNDRNILAIYCPQDGTDCYLVYGPYGFVLRVSGLPTSAELVGMQFDYDAANERVVLLKDSNTISVIDLSDVTTIASEDDFISLDLELDSEIVSVEWLPSVFYEP